MLVIRILALLTAHIIVLVVELNPDAPGHECRPIEKCHDLHRCYFTVRASPEGETHQRWTRRARDEVVLEGGKCDHEEYTKNEKGDDI